MIAGDDVLAQNVASGQASETRICIGPYRSLVTQLRGDYAIQHADFRPEDSMLAALNVAERTPIGPNSVYMGMFGNKYKFCAIPPLGSRTGPFKANRSEASAGTGDITVSNLTTVYMLLDNAIANFVLEGFAELDLTMRTNPNYERTMNIVGMTNKTPNIFKKENIVPILCTASTNAGIADGAIS